MSFNVGDKVRVKELGWGISNPELLGKVFTIVRLTHGEPFSIRLDGTASIYFWHESLLELYDDGIIRVGDTVELLANHELPTNCTVGDFEYQEELRARLQGTLIVEHTGQTMIYINGSAYWKARFKKVGTSSQIPSKYAKVINKIKEMKTRREKLGYKY